jgi:hypothetical protein
MLTVSVTDSTMTVVVRSSPAGTQPGADVQRLADQIRRACAL